MKLNAVRIKVTVFPAVPIWFFALLGCAYEDPSFTRPYRAEVLSLSSVDALGQESWTVEEKELTTLENPQSLEGGLFKLFLGGTIEINSNVGSLVEGKSRDNASKGLIRLASRNGTIVGRDTTAFLALSAFYSFEQVMKKTKDATGFEPSELKNNNEPFQIFLEPALIDGNTAKQTVVIPKLNAAFNPFSDEFYFFRRSELELRPFSTNIKVISHEFGHALFKKAFFNGKNDFCVPGTQQEFNQRLNDKYFAGRFSNEFAISGLNEGFADFNSYVMSSSPRVLSGAVLGADDESRALDGPEFTFSQIPSGTVCKGSFYCIGTLFARALYSIALPFPQGSDELMALSRRITAAITAVPNNLALSPASEILPVPSLSSAQCKRAQSISLTYDGAVTSAFLAAFLKSFPEGQEKTKLCSTFIQLFGDYGFTKEARGVCQS